MGLMVGGLSAGQVESAPTASARCGTLLDGPASVEAWFVVHELRSCSLFFPFCTVPDRGATLSRSYRLRSKPQYLPSGGEWGAHARPADAMGGVWSWLNCLDSCTAAGSKVHLEQQPVAAHGQLM
jgi:hypothetical protein